MWIAGATHLPGSVLTATGCPQTRARTHVWAGWYPVLHPVFPQCLPYFREQLSSASACWPGGWLSRTPLYPLRATDWLTDVGEKGDEGLWSAASSPREPFLRPDGIKFIGCNTDGWSQIHSQRRDVQEEKKIVLLQHRRRVWVFWAMVREMSDGNSSVWKKNTQIGEKML